MDLPSALLLPELFLTFEASAGLKHGWRSKWSKRIQEGLCERRRLKGFALGACAVRGEARADLRWGPRW